MKKILITGGSGFIGTNLIEYFLRKDSIYNLMNVDKKPPQNSEHLGLWNKCNILDYMKLSEVIKQFNPEYIIHLAARTDLDGRTLDDYQDNIKGVENIITIIKSLESIKRVIFTSSMLVCKNGYYPQNNEDFKPDTLYGESKVIGENLVRSNLPKEYPWIIVRPTSIWGPWFDKPYLAYFLLIKNKRYFNIKGHNILKVYGYVENTVTQIDAILNGGVNNETYYLADYSRYNLKEWSDEISKCFKGKNIIAFPLMIFKILALIGDFLKFLGVIFPMSSFRLKNLLTENDVPIENTKHIIELLPVSRTEGTIKTINWIEKYNK